MFQKITLANGVRLVGERVPAQDIVSIGFWFNTGSADETPETNGYTHLIEHMLFKGTKRYSSYDMVKRIEGVGGIFNAFTARHYTSFFVSILHTHIDRALDVLSDIIGESLFDADELKREKKVVCEEIKLADDSPEDLVGQQIFSNMFKGDPLAMPIAGTIKSVRSVTRDVLVKYYRKRFTADKLVVSVAGKFDFDYVARRVSSLTLRKGKTKERRAVVTPHFGAKISERVTLQQTYFSIVHEGFRSGDQRNYPLIVLSNALGGGSSSRFFQTLRERYGLCYNIYTYQSAFKNTGAFEIHGATSAKNFSLALTLIMRELDNVVAHSIRLDEIADGREMYKGALAFNRANPDYIMNKNAKNEFNVGRHLDFKDMYANINRVTPKRVEEIIQTVIAPKRFFISAVGPKGTKAQYDAFLSGAEREFNRFLLN